MFITCCERGWGRGDCTLAYALKLPWWQVSDFGLCAVKSKDNQMQMVCGTPVYMGASFPGAVRVEMCAFSYGACWCVSNSFLVSASL